MSKVICPKCGEVDSFVLTPCTKCGFLPDSHVSITFKWIFTSHNYTIEGLNKFSDYYKQFLGQTNVDARIIEFQKFTFLHNSLLFPPILDLDYENYEGLKPDKKYTFPKEFYKCYMFNVKPKCTGLL
jgi:hypothetical protein